MGMFDDIRCEYPLPLPEDQGELAGKDWAKATFQTKDLGQGMGGYCIRVDGTLWLVEPGWLRDDAFQETFQKDFFGTVEFYDTVYGRTNDYCVEWKASFVQGKLNEVGLSRWELEDNTQRLRQKAEWEASEQRTEQFFKTWVGRFIYPAYAWVIGIILRQVLAGGFSKLSTTFSRMSTFTWKLEDRLTPHGNPIGAKRRRRAMKSFFSEKPD